MLANAFISHDSVIIIKTPFFSLHGTVNHGEAAGMRMRYKNTHLLILPIPPHISKIPSPSLLKTSSSFVVKNSSGYVTV